jgi:2-oxo-3-hexenedioate decarboxylase
MTPGARATAVLAALDAPASLGPFTDTDPGFDLAEAYRTAAAHASLRRARGERPVGRKLGFTNRTIWEEYGVRAPIWGFVYDSTVRPLDAAPLELSAFREPRIEPEIVLRLATAPRHGMTPDELLGCVGGIALGFEIVQSVFPAWRFRAPDTVAAAALHGALRTGPFVPPAPGLAERLARFPVTLRRNGEEAATGNAADVLGGGPIAALAHLVALLAADPDAPSLSAGEIVSTGTLTRALPVGPGEVWRAEAGLPGLEPVAIRFAA